jgi:dihydrodipicolinate synthase/N-acetylneuraminate lyase
MKLKGVIPPMITPFKENGDVDLENLKYLVAFLTKYVDGLFITGSYGSGPLMNVEERKMVMEVTIQAAEGVVPVIPMVGTTNTRDSVELAKHAQAHGAAAVAAVGPFYFNYKEEELLNFYSDLIDAVRIPVYLYNNPKFQGYSIDFNTVKKLKERGLAGIKDATFDIMIHAQYQRQLKDDHFDVVLGTEAMFASASILGCQAFIPGLANAYPEINKKMYEEGMTGNIEACVKTQFLINELREVMYLARSTQLAIYVMLELRGIMKTYPRKPFLPATEQEKQAIRTELQRLHVL